MIYSEFKVHNRRNDNWGSGLDERGSISATEADISHRLHFTNTVRSEHYRSQGVELTPSGDKYCSFTSLPSILSHGSLYTGVTSTAADSQQNCHLNMTQLHKRGVEFCPVHTTIIARFIRQITVHSTRLLP